MYYKGKSKKVKGKKCGMICNNDYFHSRLEFLFS
jgi:hypothetical protein